MDGEKPQGFGEPHIDFAQALVQLARDHGVHSFEGSFRLGWRDERPGWSGDTVRVSWSEGRHGDESLIGLRCEQHASVPEIAPNSARILPMVYFDGQDFLELGSGKSKGAAFLDRWVSRAADYPQSREEALAALDPDTRAWLLRRHGHE